MLVIVVGRIVLIKVLGWIVLVMTVMRVGSVAAKAVATRAKTWRKRICILGVVEIKIMKRLSNQQGKWRRTLIERNDNIDSQW